MRPDRDHQRRGAAPGAAPCRSWLRAWPARACAAAARTVPRAAHARRRGSARSATAAAHRDPARAAPHRTRARFRRSRPGLAAAAAPAPSGVRAECRARRFACHPQPSSNRSTSAVFCLHQRRIGARLNVQAHQRLGVGAAQIEAPAIEFHRQPIGEVDRACARLVVVLHARQHRLVHHRLPASSARLISPLAGNSRWRSPTSSDSVLPDSP